MSTDSERARYHLDAIAGAQLALMVAVKLLLSAHKGNSQAIAAMANELEDARSLLLGSPASEYQIAAFEAAAESLIEVLS